MIEDVSCTEPDDFALDGLKAFEPFAEKFLWASSIIAGVAAVPACFKKKRVYTFIPATAEPQEVLNQPQELQIPEVLNPPPLVREKIDRLWTALADGDFSPNLWVLGNEIEEEHFVHPLTLFLRLPREKLRKIYNNPSLFTRMTVIPAIEGGFKKGIRRAMSLDKPPHWPHFWTLLPFFAAQMEKPEGQIRRLIQAGDLRALVYYLYDIET